MNHNEEVPDFLGGLGDMLPANVLKKLNELLEQQHRKDKNHQGSTVFIYAPGSQYVDKQFNIGAYPGPPRPHPLPPSPTGEGERPRGEEKGTLSPERTGDGEGPRGGEKGHIHQAKTQCQEECIRECIALLMAERYGDEPLFCLQGHWQAVYRILVDKGYCRDSDFDGFDAFIRRVMPEEVNKPYKKDSVRNINKTSFNKPFDRWRYDPGDYGTRKPYDRMVAIAQRFKEILEENGL